MVEKSNTIENFLIGSEHSCVLQNRWGAGFPVSGRFDSDTLPPSIFCNFDNGPEKLRKPAQHPQQQTNEDIPLKRLRLR